MPLIARLKTPLALLGGLAALVFAPAFLGTSANSISTLTLVVSLLLVGVGMNIVMGFAGQLFLGPGAIFAVSGFSCAIVVNKNPHLGLLEMSAIGVLTALVVSLVFAAPALRVGGFYLGMMTLYLALVVPAVGKHIDITGGDSGIALLANLDWIRPLNGYALYLVGVGLLVLMLAFSYGILHSRIGHRLITVRDSEILASSLGIRGYSTKLYAFLLGGIPTGLAAAFYVYSQQFISPNSITPTMSIYILAACVIGGFGSVLGPVTGGIIVLGFLQYSGGLGQYQGILLGLVLIAVSLVLPSGLPAAISKLRATGRDRRVVSGQTDDPESVERISEGAVAALVTPPVEPVSLVVEGLSRSFGTIKAVDDVSLTVEPGTIHALIGANGSGKTSLLNLVSGMYTPTSGVARLGDVAVTGRGPLRPVRSGIARTFQTPKLSLNRTVRDNLIVAIEQAEKCTDLESLLRLPRGRRNHRCAVARAEAALEACGIARFAHHAAGETSHGVQRLIEVARALVVNPKVVLLDEPAAGLSAAEMSILKTLITQLAEAGVAVFIIEHNLNVVFDVADTVTVLHQGAVIASGTPDEVRSAASVTQAYLGAGVSGHPGATRARGKQSAGSHQNPVLTVRGLQAGYGKLPVVTGLDLDVLPGEILAVLGRNGVGKTTTLHALGGFRFGLNGGSVVLDSVDISSLRADRIAAAGLALVPEGRRISLTMSIEENLRLGAFVHGRLSARDMQTRLDSVYELFPALHLKRADAASQLSGGQQQMVAVGQALMADPKVVLLDEPTAGLAPKLCDELYEALHTLTERSLGVIVVDQSVDRSLHNADRFLVLEDGQEVAAGSCREAGSREKISQIMLGVAAEAAVV